MMQELSRVRRFAVALLAVLCASMLFRTQIAGALVLRGDDYLYRGDPGQARERYRRALFLAPSLEVAVDRYVFITLQRQTAQSLHEAIRAATAYLNRDPADTAVRADRALCYLHLHEFTRAQDDFVLAARSSHSATDYVFAGWAAKHAGRGRAASALWREALRVHPGYRPALFALEEHRG